MIDRRLRFPQRMFFLFWLLALLAFVSPVTAQTPGATPEGGGEMAPASRGTQAEEALCGEKVRPATFYDDVSLYSLIGGFAFLFLAVVADNKKLKIGVGALSVIPLGLWLYVHFFIDYDRIKRLTFTYNAAAEATLANIAEAQDRYKSEHDTFLDDLEKLNSHMAGSHGIDACVQIVKVEAEWNRWSAVARHVASPETVSWDSRTGSSLKKG